MGKRITTVVAGMAVLALLVIAAVALTTETGQAVASGQDATSSAAAVVQECPSGQACGGCVIQGSGATAQGSSGIPSQGCDGCDAQANAPASGSGDGSCCPY